MTSYYYDGITRTHAKCRTCEKETDCGIVVEFKEDEPAIVGYFCSDNCYTNWKDDSVMKM